MSLHRSIIKTLLTSPASIADLQTITQVSLPTLRKAIQELTDARWIRVVGQSEANGGRPAMLFGADDSFYVVVGVHLQLPGVRLIATDLAGNVLDEDESFTNVVPYPDQVVQHIAAYVAHIQAGFLERRVLGVGLAAPGFTEPETGEIVTIGRVTGWQNFPILQKLRVQLGMPAFIANDVDCMAFAEFHYTGISFDKNLAYVGFDEGVKISMFFKGQLYRGALGNAGLIATHLLNLDAIRDQTADDNILTIHGVNHLVEQRIQALAPAARGAYAPILSAESQRRRFVQVLESATDDLPICQAVTNSLNTALAVAVANFVYLIQPDQVVIGGLLGEMPPPIYADFKALILGHLPSLFANRLMIQQAQLTGANTAALGATYHFLEAFLSDFSVVVPVNSQNQS